MVSPRAASTRPLRTEWIDVVVVVSCHSRTILRRSLGGTELVNALAGDHPRRSARSDIRSLSSLWRRRESNRCKRPARIIEVDVEGDGSREPFVSDRVHIEKAATVEAVRCLKVTARASPSVGNALASRAPQTIEKGTLPLWAFVEVGPSDFDGIVFREAVGGISRAAYGSRSRQVREAR